MAFTNNNHQFYRYFTTLNNWNYDGFANKYEYKYREHFYQDIAFNSTYCEININSKWNFIVAFSVHTADWNNSVSLLINNQVYCNDLAFNSDSVMIKKINNKLQIIIEDYRANNSKINIDTTNFTNLNIKLMINEENASDFAISYIRIIDLYQGVLETLSYDIYQNLSNTPINMPSSYHEGEGYEYIELIPFAPSTAKTKTFRSNYSIRDAVNINYLAMKKDDTINNFFTPPNDTTQFTDLTSYLLNTSNYGFASGSASKLSIQNSVEFKGSSTVICMNNNTFTDSYAYILTFDWKMSNGYGGGFVMGDEDDYWAFSQQLAMAPIQHGSGSNDSGGGDAYQVVDSSQRFSNYVPVVIVRHYDNWIIDVDNGTLQYAFTAGHSNRFGIRTWYGDCYVKNLKIKDLTNI